MGHFLALKWDLGKHFNAVILQGLSRVVATPDSQPGEDWKALAKAPGLNLAG